MPPRKERTPELRARLVNVAVDLLATEGVQAVTTRNVAERAGASAPAIYELFTNKSGLVRELFFEGFARLGSLLEDLPPASGTVDDVMAFADAFRTFSIANPELFRVMYSRPFSDFAPTREEAEIGATTRHALVRRVEVAVDEGVLVGDPIDMSHAFLALAIGLATQEVDGWLGSDAESRNRRWEMSLRTMLAGCRSLDPERTL
ncbi:MAG: TetR/AcrR family transcriptional regulator [Microthrixaceae bacterium]